MARKKYSTGKYLDAEAFSELEQALKDALAYERGTKRDLVVTRISKPLKARISNKASVIIKPRS